MVANFHKYQRKLYAENFKNNTCSHICSDYYKMFGRKRYISPKELKRIQKKIIDGGGRGIGRRDVRRIVQEYADKHMKNINRPPSTEGGKEVDEKTVNIYIEELAQSNDIQVNANISKKTCHRVAAENSLQSTMSYLLTIASTHFIEGEMPHDHPANKLRGTRGSKKLFSMVSKAFENMSDGKKNANLYPVYRSLIASSDDTTIFVSPGTINPKKRQIKCYLQVIMIQKHK